MKTFKQIVSESFESSMLKTVRKALLKHIPKEDIKDISTTFTKIGNRKHYFVQIGRNKTFPKGVDATITAENATHAKAKLFQRMLDLIGENKDLKQIDWSTV